MLKRLHLQNFTVFADADFEFSPGLNVLVGTNGTGKSHVLKVGYAVLETVELMSQEKNESIGLIWNENNFQGYLYNSLKGVFQPERGNLEQLIRWQATQTKTLVKAECGSGVQAQIQFSLLNAGNPKFSMQLIELDELVKQEKIGEPLFIPAKEVLTLAWISRLDERYKLPIDATYLNLLSSLRPPALKQPEKAAAESLAKLEDLVGGTIEQEGERFYIMPKVGIRVEMNLIAEGIRKFAILSQLLANGKLTSKTTLFWDEPEANLNPALLRKLAAILAELARQGFQIILATHSTDLLKEFHILSRQKDAKPLPIKYFGLNAEPGEATRIVTTDNFEYLPDVVALSEELKQADELEEIFIREDQEYHANNRGKE